MSDVGQTRTISIGTMRQWKSGLEQLGAGGDLAAVAGGLGAATAAGSGRLHEHADAGTDRLIEGLTGIKCEYEEA